MGRGWAIATLCTATWASPLGASTSTLALEVGKMSRRFVAILSAVVIAGCLSAAGEAAADPIVGTLGAARSQAGGQELSVTSRLADRREVAAGTRAYSIGFEDGRFYANGWHITGEMGGVWTPPMKLLDGVWFCLLYTSPSPRDGLLSRMPSSA